MPNSISVTKAILVFSSTIIGAGILALPVAAAEAGFIPLAAMLVILAVVAVLSGLYIAEATLAAGEELYLPSLAGKYLGAWGFSAMIVGIMIYTYGALIGYLAVGGQVIFVLSDGAISVWLGTLIYFVIGALILHRGIVLVSQINTYLMYAMIVLLAVVIGIAAPRIQVPLLRQTGWAAIFDVYGVVLFAYLGHSVIPSIVFKLEDKKKSIVVVAAGIALPALLYLLWSLVVFGAVPAVSEEAHSLAAARASGHPATVPLGFIVGGSVITLGNVFAALSTMSSYIGLGVSLRDSFDDVAVQRWRPVPPVALTGLVVVPPLLIAAYNPESFVQTLDIAGTFGGGVFIGILPVLIVMKVRAVQSAREFTTIGGTVVPYIVLVFYVFGILYMIAKIFGLLA